MIIFELWYRKEIASSDRKDKKREARGSPNEQISLIILLENRLRAVKKTGTLVNGSEVDSKLLSR